MVGGGVIFLSQNFFRNPCSWLKISKSTFSICYPITTKKERAIALPSISNNTPSPSNSSTPLTIPSPSYTSSSPQPTPSLNSLHHNQSSKYSFTTFHLTPTLRSSTNRRSREITYLTPCSSSHSTISS